MAEFGISVGCLQKILNKESLPNFTVQVNSVKKVTQQSAGRAASDRYRVVISDTERQYSSVMLATSFNGLVESGELSQHCILRVDKYQLSAPENVDRAVIILLSVKVTHSGEEVGGPLGAPQSFAQKDVAASKAAPNVSNPKPAVNIRKSHGHR